MVLPRSSLSSPRPAHVYVEDRPTENTMCLRKTTLVRDNNLSTESDAKLPSRVMQGRRLLTHHCRRPEHSSI